MKTKKTKGVAKVVIKNKTYKKTIKKSLGWYDLLGILYPTSQGEKDDLGSNVVIAPTSP